MNHPGLKQYKDFQEVLKTYHVSDRAKKALEGLKLVLLVAPSSTGRNTVIKELVDNHGYNFIISDTTRPPQVRDGKLEEEGINYFFRTEEDMLADLRAGEFLEAELIHGQQVSGISIRELENAKNQDKIAITDIDIGGMTNALMAKPDTTAILLLPPSFEQWQERLATRGRMTDKEVLNRLKTAEKILKIGVQESRFNYVIAENVKQTAEIIEAIVQGKQNPHQGRGTGVIHQLQGGLEEKLANFNHV
jgi:guanylate kinase